MMRLAGSEGTQLYGDTLPLGAGEQLPDGHDGDRRAGRRVRHGVRVGQPQPAGDVRPVGPVEPGEVVDARQRAGWVADPPDTGVPGLGEEAGQPAGCRPQPGQDGGQR